MTDTITAIERLLVKLAPHCPSLSFMPFVGCWALMSYRGDCVEIGTAESLSTVTQATLVAWVQAECQRRRWRWCCSCDPADSEAWLVTIGSGLSRDDVTREAPTLAIAALAALLGALTAEVAS